MKETIDNIDVKRYKTNHMEMYRLHTENHGMAGGVSLPSALRKLADIIELRQQAQRFSDSPLGYSEYQCDNHERPVFLFAEPFEETPECTFCDDSMEMVDFLEQC